MPQNNAIMSKIIAASLLVVDGGKGQEANVMQRHESNATTTQTKSDID